MAQTYFKGHGSGNQQNWDLAFENGYTDGLNRGCHHGSGCGSIDGIECRVATFNPITTRP